MLKNRLTIIDILIFLLILFQVNFLDLYNMPSTWNSFNSNVNKYAILIVSIFIWLASFAYSGNKESNKINHNREFSISTGFFSFMLIIVCLGSVLIYDQSLFITFQNMYWYFIFPFLYFGLKDYLLDRNNFIKFDKIVVFFGLSLAILYLLYARGIINLHPNAVIDIMNLSNGKMQYGFTRFQAPSDFIFFVSFYLSATVIIGLKKINLSFVLSQIVLLANLFLVGQVRVYFAIAVLLFLFTLFVTFVNKIKKIRVIIYFLGILLGLLLVGILVQKLQFFNGGSRQASSIVRNEEISYYLSHMFDGSIFGIGFPNIRDYYYLVRGFSPIYQAPVYYLEDVGIFGFISVFGILGVIYIILFFADLYRMFKNNTVGLPEIVLVGANLATYFTLIPLNSPRIVLMPFYLIIITIVLRNRNHEEHFISIEL